MNIIEAMKRSKETGERFQRDGGQTRWQYLDGDTLGRCFWVSPEDILADDWEPVPGSGTATNLHAYDNVHYDPISAEAIVKMKQAAREFIDGIKARQLEVATQTTQACEDSGVSDGYFHDLHEKIVKATMPTPQACKKCGKSLLWHANRLVMVGDGYCSAECADKHEVLKPPTKQDVIDFIKTLYAPQEEDPQPDIAIVEPGTLAHLAMLEQSTGHNIDPVKGVCRKCHATMPEIVCSRCPDGDPQPDIVIGE